MIYFNLYSTQIVKIIKPFFLYAEFVYDWSGPGLVFRDPGHPLAYGITITNSSTTPMMRAMIMTIQAHIIRALLFDSTAMKLPKTW